jgi:hypothetical protein
MLFRLFLVIAATHVSMAAWADSTKSIVKSDGNLNPDNAELAGWLNPEALVNMGDSQMLDGVSFSWTPVKGALLASASHVNGPMVKRNQANGFPAVRFISPTGNGAAIKFDAPTGSPTAATVFIVARADLASTSAAATYQHLWSMGASPANNGFAVSKEGKVLVGVVGANPPAVAPTFSAVSAGSLNSGSWHIYALRSKALDNSVGYTAYVDGAAASPLDTAASPFAQIDDDAATYTNGAYQIGNDEAALADGAFQGDVAEVRGVSFIQSIRCFTLSVLRCVLSLTPALSLSCTKRHWIPKT